MIKIKLYRNSNGVKEDINHAIKRFHRKVVEEEILQYLFKKKFFRSESEVRREQRRKTEYLNQFKKD